MFHAFQRHLLSSWVVVVLSAPAFLSWASLPWASLPFDRYRRSVHEYAEGSSGLLPLIEQVCRSYVAWQGNPWLTRHAANFAQTRRRLIHCANPDGVLRDRSCHLSKTVPVISYSISTHVWCLRMSLAVVPGPARFKAQHVFSSLCTLASCVF